MSQEIVELPNVMPTDQQCEMANKWWDGVNIDPVYAAKAWYARSLALESYITPLLQSLSDAGIEVVDGKVDASSVRKEFEGCITEIGANKTFRAKDDFNKGWNDSADSAIRFVRRYIKGEGLFQLKPPAPPTGSAEEVRP